MKRIFTLFLAMLMVLSLIACGAGGSAEPAQTATAEAACFKAGFGYANITPKQDGLPMAGYSDGRVSAGYMTYLENDYSLSRNYESDTCNGKLTEDNDNGYPHHIWAECVVYCGYGNKCSYYHKLIGNGVHKFAKIGDKIIFTCNLAVDKVCYCSEYEKQGGNNSVKKGVVSRKGGIENEYHYNGNEYHSENS